MKFWIKWILEWPLLVFKKSQTKNLFRTGQTGFFENFGQNFFKINYDNGHPSIHFIQNSMLNSNLKSDIQKNIKIKRLKTKKLQTEFDRVPTLK
jgi:translation initiation factor 2 beta subunit (eIF-2beta)/eIF-5